MIELSHCRNLADGRVVLGQGLNVVVGANGQGKTSLLEAVYLLGTGKSFRTNLPREIRSFGSDSASVCGWLSSPARRVLGVEVGAVSKRYILDSRRVSVSGYLGALTPVAFTAESTRLAGGAPALRRAYLDRGVLGMDKVYLHTLGAYAQALRHKNRLLADAKGGRGDRRAVAAFDRELAQRGAVIIQRRRAHVEGIKKKSPCWRRHSLSPGPPWRSLTWAPARRVDIPWERPGNSWR